jgi:3-hydroxyethyl bacteriochlorophyllide a dehydrogenase
LFGRSTTASGDASLPDAVIARLARGGEIVLAASTASQLSFSFRAAFMREVRTCAAGGSGGRRTVPPVKQLVRIGSLSLRLG